MKLSAEYSLQKEKQQSGRGCDPVTKPVKRGKVILSTTHMAGTSTDM